MIDNPQEETNQYIRLKAGDVLANYLILRKIGVGGMGEVFEAKDSKLHRKLALKILPYSHSKNKENILRFEREAQSIAALIHPNIVTLYTMEEHNNLHFLTMELVEGNKLTSLIDSDGLPFNQLYDWAENLSLAVATAHKQGIAHRDLKPDNIMINDQGQLKILDFGLAKLMVDNQQDDTIEVSNQEISKAGHIVGTVPYMSPEQLEGKDIQTSSDIFSLGVILYEMTTGANPFRKASQAATISSILTFHPPLVETIRNDVSFEFSQIIKKCLQKEPSDRFKNAHELYTAIQNFKQGITSSFIVQSIDKSPIEKSIAVLPFTNMSADVENEYFSDGVTDEIINALGQLKNLRVAARTSSFYYKNKQVDIKDVGEKLQVDNILEGSIRKAGNKIRISAQLINVSDGYNLWSEKYDHELEDIFEIQEKIAKAITEKLKVTLTGSEENTIIKPGTNNLSAYDLYLKGKFYWEQRGKKLITALEYFTKAIELDPGFAMAYVGLSDSYHMMGLYGIKHNEACMPLAEKYANKALELDESLAEAYTSLGMVNILYTHDWAAAENAFRKTIELKPHYPQARYWYALWYLYLHKEDLREAKLEAKRAVEIDPLAVLPIAHQLLIYMMEDEHDFVLTVMDEITKRDPQVLKTYWWMKGYCLARSGQFKRALDICQDNLNVQSRHPWTIAYGGYILAKCGKQDKAQELYNDFLEVRKQNFISPYPLSIIPQALGDLDTAIKHLEEAVEINDPAILLTKKWGMFEALRDDPRYYPLLKKAKLI